MKRRLSGAALLLLLTCAAQSVTATKQPLYPKPAEARPALKAALAKAKAEHRLVLVDFGANWCPACQGLNELFASNANVREALARRFVVLNVNVGDFDRNLDLAENLAVDLDDTGIPVLAVLDADGRVLAVQETGAFEGEDEEDYSTTAILRFLNKDFARR
jgi:thiol:disulfide interchange protein